MSKKLIRGTDHVYLRMERIDPVEHASTVGEVAEVELNGGGLGVVDQC